jgi:RNA polymerase sigma-70 factor (ECF subfamily)
LLDHERESLFKDWLDQHAGLVVKVARAYTLTADDCQDLMQEIFLQVWRSLAQFEGRASAATWSYRVALNTALSWQRNQRRRQVNRQPIVEMHEVLEPAGDSAAHAENRELIERLYAAIRQLPKGDAALVLLYLDELSYREIAEVLGISESNVGVKLNRAKKNLAELMGDQDGTKRTEASMANLRIKSAAKH